MKTQRRHELQTNDLADRLGGSIEQLRPYGRVIGGVLLLAVVGAVAVVVLRNRARAAEEAAWTAYRQAFLAEKSEDMEAELEAVANKHGTSAPGQWAHVMLGERKLSEGIDLLFTDRKKGNDAVAAAVVHFEAAPGAQEPAVKQLAEWGLGRAYESQQGKLSDAREVYARLSETWPESIYGQKAKQRLAELETDEAKEFYDWFAEETSKTFPEVSTEESLLPGGGPDFDDPDSLRLGPASGDPETDEPAAGESGGDIDLSPGFGGESTDDAAPAQGESEAPATGTPESEGTEPEAAEPDETPAEPAADE